MHDVGDVMAIHPAFRVVALAAPPTAAKDSYLTPETSTLFRYHPLPRYSADDRAVIMRSLFPSLAEALAPQGAQGA